MTDTLAFFTLPATPEIYTVDTLRIQWLAWLALVREQAVDVALSPAPVEASDVEEIDGSGVQLLLSLALALRSENRTLALRGAGPRLIEACQALGAGQLIRDSLTSEVVA